jgi:hypothetical protein
VDMRVISLGVGPKVACVRKRAAAAGALVGVDSDVLSPPLDGPCVAGPASGLVPAPPPQADKKDANTTAPTRHCFVFA